MSRDAGPADVLRAASSLLSRGIDVCVATVVGAEGSSPSTPGQKLLLGKDGSVLGTVGGGAVEQEAVERMKALLATGGSVPEMQWYALAKDLGMACGGRVHLMFEPMAAASPVLLVGAGHIGAALATLLSRVGFRVVITDERPSALTPERLGNSPEVEARNGPPREVASDMPVTTPVIVATHDHALDEAAIVWAVERGHVYVGGVGSKGKAAKTRKTLEARGIDAVRIEQLRMPVGLKLGGRSPEEIALSIAAELVAWRAGKLADFTG
jgi:xanthine dehydrogenase accessory factor